MSELLSLFIAWQIARVSGLNQAAAVRKSARRLRKTCDCRSIIELLDLLASDINDESVVTTITVMFNTYENNRVDYD